MSTLILTQSDVRALLRMEDAVPAMEQVFAAHGRGETIMPHKIYLSLDKNFTGDFRAMPAYFDGAAGVKWVNSHPQNPARHKLPSVMGLYILSDPATALPLAILDATALTALRTGAAAAVASRHLAKPSPKTIGLVGCGVQARTLLAAHRVVFGGLELRCADAFPEAADRFAHECGGRAVPIKEAAAADIVCTATPSRVPVVQREWVRAGAHINAMGADAPGKQELDPEILDDARIVIDDWEQATESGEVNVSLSTGRFAKSHIYGTLGEVVAGKLAGRSGADEITVFDSTGLAVQDLALARVVYQAARDRKIGQQVDFLSSP
jgi:ornithine cyclodeaminase/alanine dehydrogenase